MRAPFTLIIDDIQQAFCPQLGRLCSTLLHKNVSEVYGLTCILVSRIARWKDRSSTRFIAWFSEANEPSSSSLSS